MSAGVLHRDVKPENVLLTNEGVAKLADFGIAKAVEPSPLGGDETTLNAVLGTPSYLAPERLLGEPATVGADLWSVGVLLYESLTGRKPFSGPTPVAVAVAAQEGHYQTVLERKPGVDPAIAGVIDRALQPDPSKRFMSAAEMGRSLRRTPVDLTLDIRLAATGLHASRALEAPASTRLVRRRAPVAVAGTPLLGPPAPTSPRSSSNSTVPIDRLHPCQRNLPRVSVATAALLLVAAIGALLLGAGQGRLRPPLTVGTTKTTSRVHVGNTATPGIKTTSLTTTPSATTPAPRSRSGSTPSGTEPGAGTNSLRPRTSENAAEPQQGNGPRSRHGHGGGHDNGDRNGGGDDQGDQGGH